jgi:hypothetical protein
MAAPVTPDNARTDQLGVVPRRPPGNGTCAARDTVRHAATGRRCPPIAECHHCLERRPALTPGTISTKQRLNRREET